MKFILIGIMVFTSVATWAQELNREVPRQDYWFCHQDKCWVNLTLGAGKVIALPIPDDIEEQIYLRISKKF